MRVVGTLAGLLGAGMLSIGPFILYHAYTERSPLMMVFAVFPLVFGVYFVYVGYLVWFKYSPLAVRHICGTVAFYVFVLVSKLFGAGREAEPSWVTFAPLGCLFVVFFAYRLASARLSRWLFPESASGIQS